MITINKKIELLAPAGDMDSLYAAVNSGADAVYMGGSKFSARAYAKNFSEEDIKEAIEYCHIYGVKVYITINTLIKQNEILEVLKYIEELQRIGVDAVITQDLGLAAAVFKNFEGFEVHASTQMTVHNREASLFLRDLGFKRIVLSRELSLKEISEISKDVETEIFVHGALCVCYSGQCLMSSMIGGRSGNRGRCAQPCRLPYDVINKVTGSSKKGYLLSPKDICTISNFGEIIDSGVTSFKIEGRMKRPEYVAGVVQSYRKAIDDHLSGVYVKDRKSEEQRMLQLFNREGFSKGYLFGNEGRNMMAYSFPKNTGVPLGKAVDKNLLSLTDTITIGDGIRVAEEGTVVSKIIKEGREVEAAAAGDIVKITPMIYKKGDTVFKTNDSILNEELKQLYINKYLRKIGVELVVYFNPGEPIKLKGFCKDKEYEASGTKVEIALSKPLTKEFIEDKLRKTGNTPYVVENIKFMSFREGYVSAAALNECRRELLDQITKGRTAVINGSVPERSLKTAANTNLGNHKKGTSQVPENMFVVSTEEQLKALANLGVDTAAVDVYSRSFNKNNLFSYGIENIFLKLPNIVRGEYKAVAAFVEENIENIKGIITANLGLINEFKDKTLCIGDYKLNIFNSEALAFIKEYCEVTAISVELNKAEIKETISNSNSSAAAQVVLYGKTELMVSEYCSVGSVLGGRSRDKNCSANCQERHVLKDRKGTEFAILNDVFCRSHIYNSVPINLYPFAEELKNMGVSHFRYDFIDESYKETYNIVRAVIEKQSFNIEEYTRGHYKRGVE